jgi:hypothetical protein
MEIEMKEFQDLFEKIGKENGAKIESSVKDAVSEATKGLLTSEKLTETLEKNGIKADTIETLTKAVEKQGIELQKFISGKGGSENKSIAQMLEEKKEELKALASGDKNRTIKMTVKAPVLRASVTNTTQAMRLDDIGQVAHRGLTLSSLFRQRPVAPNSNGVIRYTDQSAPTRAAAAVAENNAFPESTFPWQEYTLNIQKIGDQVPVSVEAFNDVDYIAGEIQALLEINVRLKEDQDLWNANGVAPNIRGIFDYAPTYSAPDLALDDPNLYDLIVKVQEDINAGRESKFRANTCLVSYADFSGLLIKKAVDGHYVRPEWAQLLPDGTANVNGIKVIPHALPTANTMLVGDFNWGEQFNMGDVEVEMGFIANQFINDMMTIKARKRTALLVRNVNLNAFRKVTDIAAAISALD